MTPQQSHRRAEIMLKHGADSFEIQSRERHTSKEYYQTKNPNWDWVQYDFRAVRIEKTTIRTPLPIEHYKRGMEIIAFQRSRLVIQCGQAIMILDNGSHVGAEDIECWRWPHETEWRPAYTDIVEEKEVERLEVEG